MAVKACEKKQHHREHEWYDGPLRRECPGKGGGDVREGVCVTCGEKVSLDSRVLM